MKRSEGTKHPYLTGNFAAVEKTTPLTRCTYTGRIPDELVGGEYVRNGVNPITNEDLGRDAHWFDGDGMLTGVAFQRSKNGTVEAHFVNQYVLTDLYLAAKASPHLRLPIMPSIATLVNPLSSMATVLFSIFRTVLLVILSHLPGSPQAIKKISVSNTALLYHDGRALATCESGPPMRIQLPELETVGWFDGNHADGEPVVTPEEPGFGGEGLFSWVKEWTTGHPKVDPLTKEMILFHCSFVKPYVHYSVIPSSTYVAEKLRLPKLLNLPVPGCSGGKMMHDFGVSREHTIIMDLPLSLDPFNHARGKPTLFYDPSRPSRFGVFPRHDPAKVRWFETAACCIFHTANAWDTRDASGTATAVNFLACRQTSAAVIFSSGNIIAPEHAKYNDGERDQNSLYESFKDEETNVDIEKRAFPSANMDPPDPSQRHALEIAHQHSSAEDDSQCRLYHYVFSLVDASTPTITTQHALSAIPLEFPTLNPSYEMTAARYIYGCSTSIATFGAALGKAAKIDVLVKMDVRELVARGNKNTPTPVTGCVDGRDVDEVLRDQARGGARAGPIRCFRMPAGWYGQEARFVARRDAVEEDDGFLLFYAFDEAQLDGEGEAPAEAVSELWILDARDMETVVGRVRLPQRVPYGLHGNWFDEGMIEGQRPVERLRGWEEVERRRGEMGRGGVMWRNWMRARQEMERIIG